MGGGKSSTSTQSVSIPPEVLARYNAVNARAETTAEQPFQQYGGEFVAPLNPVQTAGVNATSANSQLAQPYYGAAAGLTMSGAKDVGPLTQGQIGYYQNPYTQAVVNPTVQALQQQQGQQLADQQAQAIKGGAFGGDRAGLQRAQLQGQQNLGMAQAIAPLYQQGYGQAVQTAQTQQGVVASDLARRMQAGQQVAGLGTGAQQAALQGAQAQIGAGTLGQQTQQAQDTAQYQQFLQERGYPFQVSQFLANIAMGTGALSGSTTSTTQPRGFFSNRGGFKTGESLQRAGKAYGGGLDPNSMGGSVYEPGAFERGGYATSGSVVDPTDLNAILAQQQSFQSPRGGVGPYGQAPGAAPHGPSGIVPQQRLATPKLVTAGAPPKAAPGAGSELSKIYSLANEATTGLTGKGLTERAGEKIGLRDSAGKIAEAKGADMPGASANATTGSQNPVGGVAPTPTPRDLTATAGEEGLLDKAKNFFGFEHGGGVMPRHYYADGGGDDSQADEAIPYDPSDVQGGKDPMEGVLKAGTQRPQLKTAGSGGGGGGGGGLGGDLMKGAGLISAGKTLYSAGSGLASFLPTLFLAEGGVVPRQHHADGERANSDLPLDAGIVERAPGLDPNVVSELKREEQRQATIPQDVKGLVPAASTREPDYRSMAHEAALEYGIDPVKFGNVIQGESGFTPKPGDDNSSGGLLQFHFKGASAKYPHAGVGDAFIAEKAPELHKAGSPEEKLAFLNDPNNQRDLLRYGAQHISKNGWGDWTVARQLGYAGDKNAPRPPSDIGRSAESEGLGGAKPTSFIDGIGFNKQTILPLLQGIGAMASSKSISPWAAALQGLGAGAKAYGDVEAQQAGIEQTKAGTTSTLSNIPIGNMIGTFNPETGKIEYRPRPDYFAPSAFPPKKLTDAQNEAIKRGQVATGLVKPSMQGGAYTVDVEPGQTANREFSQYGYTGGDKDAYVVPSTIGTQPALAKKAAEDQAAAQKRTEAGAMVPQTRLETNMLVDSVLGISPYGFTGDGPNQSARARAVNLYNWGVKNIFGGPAEIEKENVTSSQIINKLTRQLGAQFAGAAGFHASGLADALKDAQISGELTKEASIKLASSMYVRQQMEEDFSKYYNNYMKKYGTAYNVQNNFAREMGNQYEEEKKSLQRALTPIEKEGKWSSPVMELRKNPALAPQFDAYFKKPGLARMLLGG